MSWLFIQPVANVFVLTIVFSYIAKTPSEGIPYPLFSFGALLPWVFFSSSITSGIPSLTNNPNLVTKIYFPREILPISTIISVSFDTMISAAIFICLMVYYKVNITMYALFVIPIIIIEFVFIMGLVFLLSAINVWYRDAAQASNILTQFWMYLTPVIYPLSLVPEKFMPFYVLNPMVGIVEGFRSALLKGRMPDMTLLGISACISIIAFIVGYSIFKSKEFDFADVI
jgi:lipopolysaccharide transport system permease protein